MRTDERAASIAVLPPPTTTTRLPLRSTCIPSSRFCRNSVPFQTPSRSSPSQRSEELPQAPITIRIAFSEQFWCHGSRHFAIQPSFRAGDFLLPLVVIKVAPRFCTFTSLVYGFSHDSGNIVKVAEFNIEVCTNSLFG